MLTPHRRREKPSDADIGSRERNGRADRLGAYTVWD